LRETLQTGREPFQIDAVPKEMHAVPRDAEANERVDIFDALHQLGIAKARSEALCRVHGKPTF